MTVKEAFNKWYKNILIGGAILALFGTSYLTTIKRFKVIWYLNTRVEYLEKQDSIKTNKLRNLRDYQEMDWEFGRLMTDDDDKGSWYIITDSGNEYNVDIRANAEDVQLSYIFDIHMKYPIYISPADGKKYIIVHNHNRNENQNLYLQER